MPHAARIGVRRDDAEGGGAEEVLRHRAPQIPQRLDRRVLLALDEGLRIEPELLAELAQEFRRAVQADRRLQIGTIQRFAELAAEFAIEADIDVGVGESRHIRKMAAEREDHVDLGADALDQAADLGKVRRHVEDAVAGADDVHARLFAGGALRFGAGLFLGHIRSTASSWRDWRIATGPRRWCAAGSAGSPVPSGVTPPPIISAMRAGDDHARQIGIERRMRALHRALGAVAAEFFLGHAPRSSVTASSDSAGPIPRSAGCPPRPSSNGAPPIVRRPRRAGDTQDGGERTRQ